MIPKADPLYQIPWQNYNRFGLTSYTTNIIIKSTNSYFLFNDLFFIQNILFTVSLLSYSSIIPFLSFLQVMRVYSTIDFHFC